MGPSSCDRCGYLQPFPRPDDLTGYRALVTSSAGTLCRDCDRLREEYETWGQFDAWLVERKIQRPDLFAV